MRHTRGGEGANGLDSGQHLSKAENAELVDPDSDLSLLLAAGPVRGLRLSATSGRFRQVAEIREEPGLELEGTSENSDA